MEIHGIGLSQGLQRVVGYHLGAQQGAVYGWVGWVEKEHHWKEKNKQWVRSKGIG